MPERCRSTIASADRLPAWRGADREARHDRDLLAHASGLTAYLPFFRDHHGRAGVRAQRSARCRSSTRRARSRSTATSGSCCSASSSRTSASEPLGDAVRSDLVGDGSRRQIEDLRVQSAAEWRERTAPTELDLWRGRLLQGEVHDENTWALGGAAGHAGLFGTAACRRRVSRGLMLDTTARDDTRARASQTPWQPFAARRPYPAARARSAGTRCCRRRRAARRCRRARSATPASPARRSGSIRRRISTSCC